MPHSFFTAPPPQPEDWNAALQQHWAAVRQLGQWPFILRAMGAWLTQRTALLIYACLLSALAVPTVVTLLRGVPLESAAMLWFLVHTPWLLPAIGAAILLAAFVAGHGRWSIYECLFGLYADVRPIVRAIRSGLAPQELFALISVPLSGAVPDRVLRYDGARWQEIATFQAAQPLIDLLPLPDRRLLLIRVGGDLITWAPDRPAQTLATGMDGGYLLPMGARILLAGAPTSQWYDPAQGTLTPIAVSLTAWPALHQDRAYLLDRASAQITVVDAATITPVAPPPGATLAALAIAEDAPLVVAAYPDRRAPSGRLFLRTGAQWHERPAPGAGPIGDLAWDGADLLAVTPQGLAQADRMVARWRRERDGTGAERFFATTQGLLLVDTVTGQILTRRDGGWHADLPPVPLA